MLSKYHVRITKWTFNENIIPVPHAIIVSSLGCGAYLCVPCCDLSSSVHGIHQVQITTQTREVYYYPNKDTLLQSWKQEKSLKKTTAKEGRKSVGTLYNHQLKSSLLPPSTEITSPSPIN